MAWHPANGEWISEIARYNLHSKKKKKQCFGDVVVPHLPFALENSAPPWWPNFYEHLPADPKVTGWHPGICILMEAKEPQVVEIFGALHYGATHNHIVHGFEM